jgi:general secretion pathway protein I
VKHARGFSLIEVLLAFALLATSLGILVSILSGGLNQVRRAGDATQATLHAQSLLATVGVLEPIEPGLQRGDFDDGRYRWELDVRIVPDPAPVGVPGAAVVEAAGPQLPSAPVLYRVALKVRWGDEDAPREIDLVTLRARAPEPVAAPLP